MIELILVFLAGICIGVGFVALYFERKHEGIMQVKIDEGRTVYSLVLLDDPETLVDKKSITFKVQRPE